MKDALLYRFLITIGHKLLSGKRYSSQATYNTKQLTNYGHFWLSLWEDLFLSRSTNQAKIHLRQNSLPTREVAINMACISNNFVFPNIALREIVKKFNETF